MLVLFCYFFFFQAEDGIRDRNVTGVQTCALPIFFVPQAAAVRGELIAQYHFTFVQTKLQLEVDQNQTSIIEQFFQHVIRFVRSEERRVGKECRSRWQRSDRRKQGAHQGETRGDVQ